MVIYGLYYIRQKLHSPTKLRTYPHVVFQQHQAAVGLIHSRSDTLHKKSQTTVGRLHSFFELVALFCMSDAQYLQVGILMHNISRSDAQIQQVGCTTLVGWMHNFSRLDAQLQKVGCTTLVDRMDNFCRLDQLLQLLTKDVHMTLQNVCI